MASTNDAPVPWNHGPYRQTVGRECPQWVESCHSAAYADAMPRVLCLALLLAMFASSPLGAKSDNPWLAACVGHTPKLPGVLWEKPSPPSSTAPELASDRYWLVTRNQSSAASKLARRSFIELTKAQVTALLGSQPDVKARHQVRPFLVRAIGEFPRASWDGRTLHMTGSAMGACPDVEKRPMIVFLERSPEQVFVDTVGAL